MSFGFSPSPWRPLARRKTLSLSRLKVILFSPEMMASRSPRISHLEIKRLGMNFSRRKLSTPFRAATNPILLVVRDTIRSAFFAPHWVTMLFKSPCVCSMVAILGMAFMRFTKLLFLSAICRFPFCCLLLQRQFSSSILICFKDFRTSLSLGPASPFPLGSRAAPRQKPPSWAS